MIRDQEPDSIGFSDDALAAELERLGVPFVAPLSDDRVSSIPRTVFLADLATSSDARLRMALIPLFLAHPEYAQGLADWTTALSGQVRVTLICYYTAARLVQQKYFQRLSQLGFNLEELPDLFSVELGITVVGDPDEILRSLAERHAELSGRALNWYGTYEQAALRFFKRLEWEYQWVTS